MMSLDALTMLLLAPDRGIDEAGALGNLAHQGLSMVRRGSGISDPSKRGCRLWATYLNLKQPAAAATRAINVA
jgi:hypothetical protein